MTTLQKRNLKPQAVETAPATMREVAHPKEVEEGAEALPEVVEASFPEEEDSEEAVEDQEAEDSVALEDLPVDPPEDRHPTSKEEKVAHL